MFKRITLYFHFLQSLLRVNIGLLRGMWKLTKLPQPAITIFGGTKLPSTHPASKTIRILAEKLVSHGFSIITGGGPGIMEAANFGAIEHLKKDGESHLVSIGIGVSNVQPFNKYVQGHIIQPYFFTRKWLLVRAAVGFVVAPGGFGTLDELTEVLTLIQTHKMPKSPIVLIDRDYWQPLIEWVNNHLLKDKLIHEKDVNLFKIADNADEALQIILSKCSGYAPCSLEAQPVEKK